MRLYAIAGFPAKPGAEVLAIPTVGVLRGDANPHLIFTRSGEQYDIIAIPFLDDAPLEPQSNAPSRTWDLFALVADSRDSLDGRHLWVQRLWRHARRVMDTPAPVKKILGPMSPAEFSEAYPGVIDSLEGWTFPILAGDSHDAVAAWDYRPTQEQIDSDEDWYPPEVDE